MRLFHHIIIYWTLCVLSINILAQSDYTTQLLSKLSDEIGNSSNEFYILHCNSIKEVLNAYAANSANSDSYSELIYERFISEMPDLSAAGLENYISRGWPFIIAWTSPQDGETSFTWLRLPKNWDPDKEYPMYVQLHGYWDVADDPMRYMAFPFDSQSTTYAFEDGYHLSPWGRGNHWYTGEYEEDIWECMEAVKRYFMIDEDRQYICGHSMGGYGAWHIAHQSASNWAAFGLHAAAIWWNPAEVTYTEAANLASVPGYFVCGTNDGNINMMQDAYQLLHNAGNTNLEFATFSGGHEYRQQDVEAMYDWMRQFSRDGFVNLQAPLSAEKNWINVYPTNVKEQIQVEFLIDKHTEVRIEMVNVLGQTVGQPVRANYGKGLYRKTFLIENAEAGVHFIIFQTSEKKFVTKIYVSH